MNIEKLSDTKLEVLITQEDMKKWNVDVECLTKNSPQSHTLFSDIIAQAQEQYDFSCSGANVVIETQVCKDGGLKLFFNAVPSIEAEIPALEACAPKPQKMIVLKLHGVEDVYAAMRHLRPYYKGASSLYKYKDNYYITMQSQLIDISKTYDLGEIMDDPDILCGYLNEYGVNLVRDSFFSKEKTTVENTKTTKSVKGTVVKKRINPVVK